MTSKAMDYVRRAIDSSAVVHLVRPAIAGSAVCASAASVGRWLQRTQQRIVVGLGGRWSARQGVRTNQQLDAMAADSRVIGALSSLLTAASVARREAGVTRLLDLMLGLDLLERIRISGCIIVVAVMTHTVLLAVLGVAVHEVGWGIRAGLVVGCVVPVRWPGPFAAAWRDKTAHRGAHAHDLIE